MMTKRANTWRDTVQPDQQQTTERREFEPLDPACLACREPRGTCFPGPCKRHLARQAALNELTHIGEGVGDYG